jgi:hypothetical protein
MQFSKDPKDYPKELVKFLKETEKELPPSERMEQRHLELFCNRMHDAAMTAQLEWIKGNRMDYQLTSEEFDECYDAAGLDYTQGILDGLLDKGLIEAGVDQDGQIVYKATEEGLKIGGSLKS